jgi:multidrug efflux pump
MTTAAMAQGVLPPGYGFRAGAQGRYNTGLVTATVIAIGTRFSLFVVSVIYLLLAADHARSGAGAELPEPPPAGGSAKVFRQEAYLGDDSSQKGVSFSKTQ